MPLYDISLTLTEDLPTWPGDPPIHLKRISSIADGETANITHLSAAVHIGTHVDAPDHYLNNGKTVEEIPLDLMVGQAAVVEVTAEKTISASDLQAAGIIGQHKRLLLKTNNSQFWAEEISSFQEEYLGLDRSAAEYLVDCGIEVVGVDYLSVAPFHDSEPTHRLLLEADILIIEGLDLSGIIPGEYTLLCLPLKIGGADGAPARVLLQD